MDKRRAKGEGKSMAGQGSGKLSRGCAELAYATCRNIG